MNTQPFESLVLVVIQDGCGGRGRCDHQLLISQRHFLRWRGLESARD